VYVNFDLDSAAIRSDSDQILADLYEGISGVSGRVTIEGHTSTEGTADYNLALSERRARAVVEDLVRRGFDASRISAVGKGESEPMVSESDEASRAINRRVRVTCGTS
jgi:OOP family OmpA-OmpF porin